MRSLLDKRPEVDDYEENLDFGVTPILFAKLLEVAMVWSDLTPEKLAEELRRIRYAPNGMNPQTINGWLRGELASPSLKLLNALAKVTEQSALYFQGQEPLNQSVGIGKRYKLDFRQWERMEDAGGVEDVYNDEETSHGLQEDYDLLCAAVRS